MKTLSRLLLVFAILMLNHQLFAQSKSVENLYQKYKGNPDFFHFDLGGSFLNFAKSMDVKLDQGKAESLASSMERMKLFKLPTEGQAAHAEFQALKRALEKERYELMMEASERKSSFMVYTKGTRRIQDVVVLVKEESGGFLVLEFQGDFDAKTLADIGKDIR
ncbi:DUF4252 domain-containing protein [Cecembia rubra]|uniref:Uncharacterized protein DUF4252 n=1 Tax=Cecembia rubra TaxID=1485585 RepID=A0A2P8E4K9_9BACT|nr:DUF4252 domain-containing protein [Cecembia rubra]PSL04400.1 uncharacterized protein DUF4252 [Cecembia rubra]